MEEKGLLDFGLTHGWRKDTQVDIFQTTGNY